jgi:hypothetical protein
MEQMFVQHICPAAKVQLINCNGDDVQLGAIANRLASLIRLLKQRWTPIVIIIDREERSDAASAVAKTLLDLLRARQIQDEIILGVADRNMETWILADKTVLTKLRPKLDPKSYEGEDGKRVLKEWLKPYHETVQGVDLLKQCSPARMSRSASFRTFFGELSAHSKVRTCWWIRRD